MVYITVATRTEAERLGRTLLQERLVACINLVGPISSRYWWQGKVESVREMLVVAKTRAGLAQAVIQRIKAIHSYKVPCVVTIPLHAGNPDFMRWVAQETRSAQRRSSSCARARRASQSG